MPFVLLGCSQECIFPDKVFGVFFAVVGIFLFSAQKELAMAEKGFASRIEVGLMLLLLDSISEEEEDGEQIVKKPLKILGELKKNEVGFVGFSGGIHGRLL